MLNKIKAISVLFILFSSYSWSWEVVKTPTESLLTDKSLKIKTPITIADHANNVEVINLSNKTIVLRYLESVAGTKYIVENFNCILFNVDKNKIIAKDLLCKTLKSEKSNFKVEEATFKENGNLIEYQFEELSSTFKR
jgi:hypothetical protein